MSKSQNVKSRNVKKSDFVGDCLRSLALAAKGLAIHSSPTIIFFLASSTTNKFGRYFDQMQGRFLD